MKQITTIILAVLLFSACSSNATIDNNDTNLQTSNKTTSPTVTSNVTTTMTTTSAVETTSIVTSKPDDTDKFACFITDDVATYDANSKTICFAYSKSTRKEDVKKLESYLESISIITNENQGMRLRYKDNELDINEKDKEGNTKLIATYNLITKINDDTAVTTKPDGEKNSNASTATKCHVAGFESYDEDSKICQAEYAKNKLADIKKNNYLVDGDPISGVNQDMIEFFYDNSTELFDYFMKNNQKLDTSSLASATNEVDSQVLNYLTPSFAVHKEGYISVSFGVPNAAVNSNDTTGTAIPGNLIGKTITVPTWNKSHFIKYDDLYRGVHFDAVTGYDDNTTLFLPLKSVKLNNGKLSSSFYRYVGLYAYSTQANKDKGIFVNHILPLFTGFYWNASQDISFTQNELDEFEEMARNNHYQITKNGILWIMKRDDYVVSNYPVNAHDIVIFDTVSLKLIEIETQTMNTDPSRIIWNLYDGKSRMKFSTYYSDDAMRGVIIHNMYAGTWFGKNAYDGSTEQCGVYMLDRLVANH